MFGTMREPLSGTKYRNNSQIVVCRSSLATSSVQEMYSSRPTSDVTAAWPFDRARLALSAMSRILVDLGMSSLRLMIQPLAMATQNRRISCMKDVCYAFKTGRGSSYQLINRYDIQTVKIHNSIQRSLSHINGGSCNIKHNNN